MGAMKSAVRLTALLAIVTTVAAGCTSGPGVGDKAGGSSEPVTLRLANGYANLEYEPSVAYFVRRVEELSRGNLSIEVVHQRGILDEPQFEQEIVGDVATDKVNMAWVGTRVFDTLGVGSFQALTAPMLIDSYPLERAVIASDVPAQMLEELDRLHVTGLAVLGDGLRKPIAVERPLLAPADWQSMTFAAFRSDGQADAVRALGATPSDLWGGPLQHALDAGQVEGFEKSLLIYDINALEARAPYVTANVNLWPQTVALLANPKRLEKLTDEQRGWLEQAARQAATRSTGLFEHEDGYVAEICAAGGRFANASQADLDGLRQALAPVYASLSQDPQTRGLIGEIQKLKDATQAGAPLAIPATCTGPAPVQPGSGGPPPTYLNGTYRWTITKADALAHGTEQDRTPEGLVGFPSTVTMTLNDGAWTFTAGSGYNGSYSLKNGRLQFLWSPNVLTFSVSIDANGDLHVTPRLPMNQGDQLIWASEPWTKIAGPRPPPTIPDGVYRSVVSVQELLEAGVPATESKENGGLQTMTIEGFRWTINVKNTPHDCHGYLSYSDAQVSLVGDDVACGPPVELLFTAGWTLGGGQLRFIDLRAALQSEQVFFQTAFGSKPWSKVG